MSQPEKFLIADAAEVADAGLMAAVGKAAPAALLICGSLASARREDLLALRQGTAVLTDRPEEISRTNLDGAHIEPYRPIKADRARFSSLNLGAGGLASRHEAMQAGEDGADYVAFGSLTNAQNGTEFDKALELAVWWAGIMTTPCVVRAADAAQALAAAEGGVDFIACRWQDHETVFNGT